jgi:mannose-6-phosphate isomerase
MDRLTNTVRPYAWGSATAIPELLGAAPTGEPQAEMWMGAHPGAPSRIDRGHGPVALDQIIGADPHTELGAASVDRFGPRLPFLLKLLAAGSPLSLQVHPDLEQARAGFADEQARGVPIDAPHRTYKDPNHKPEMIVALVPFDGLCGFRDPDEAADILESLGVDALKPYADALRGRPREEALREVLTAILTANRDAMAETVAAAADAAARIGAAATEAGASRAAVTNADAPVAGAGSRRTAASSSYAAYASIARAYPGDPGVIAAMLLNHVRLQPGEALYLGAGVPHAYLEGLGVEIMANSDNVLRCGLTPKHVDVPELLRIVRFRASGPGVRRPRPLPDGEELYETPVDEFRLSRYVLTGEDTGNRPRALDPQAPQILLCTQGTAHLTAAPPDTAGSSGAAPAQLALAPGQSAYIPAGERVHLTGTATVFRATVAV